VKRFVEIKKEAAETLKEILPEEEKMINSLNRINFYLIQVSQGINPTDAAINCGLIQPKQ